MAKQPSDVSAHYDVSAVVEHGNPARAHPHDSVPTRVASPSGFAGPMDVPAQQSRPSRSIGSIHDHPLNCAIDTDDESLIGSQLGVHPSTPVQATTTYVSPGQPMDKFEKNADIAAANANFIDRSDLLMRPRRGVTT